MPKKTWWDSVGEDMRSFGMPYEDVQDMDE